MSSITMLDCTLRDGAYITDSVFGEASIRGIINKMEEAGIEIIECGWLKNSDHKSGSTYFHMPSELMPYLTRKDRHRVYVVMIDWDRYDLDHLPQNDHNSIDAVRVVFPSKHFMEGIEVGRKILKKGYKVYFQAANTLGYSDDDLVLLAKEVSASEAEALSIVDTFGAMYPEDLERIVKILNANLDKRIKLGFHSHNNQQLSFALSMEFAKMLETLERDGIIDASLCGMGRGAGNATTELVASYLNRKHNAHYDLDAIMDAIDTYMEPYKMQYEWGYSTPYFIAGLYCSHVNNIAYLLNNHRTSAKQMRNIIESLSPDDRKKYDYNLLEKKYIMNESFNCNDETEFKMIEDLISCKDVLIIAPGKSALLKQAYINEFIKANHPIVFAVNAILEGYNYDYLFLVNSARYEFAKMSHPDIFQRTMKIVLSTVKNKPDANEYIIRADRAIKKGWNFFDNAVICALRLLDKLNPSKVYIAGFDGFKTKYNESYADASLPSLNPGNDWNDINREITDMYRDFKYNSDIGNKIQFITESIFDDESKR